MLLNFSLSFNRSTFLNLSLAPLIRKLPLTRLNIHLTFLSHVPHLTYFPIHLLLILHFLIISPFMPISWSHLILHLQDTPEFLKLSATSKLSTQITSLMTSCLLLSTPLPP